VPASDPTHQRYGCRPWHVGRARRSGVFKRKLTRSCTICGPAGRHCLLLNPDGSWLNSVLTAPDSAVSVSTVAALRTPLDLHMCTHENPRNRIEGWTKFISA
jgi:hypothetical protein